MRDQPLVIFVGSGGVGKTTLAAAWGAVTARDGHETLVMTFDPSRRLKDALAVGDSANDREAEVPGAARLHASLLDAQSTFDRLVKRYAHSEKERARILHNRFYRNLSGSLAGVLEYMAVMRLFEVAEEERFDRVILDTPPTRQALDFLGAPERIIGFLDSGALGIALRPWFDEEGHLRGAHRFGRLGRSVEGFLDRIIGIDFLRDMAEFFQAFSPLYEGVRRHAVRVQELLRHHQTMFVLVTGPGEERIPDTLFFARKLLEAGYTLGPVIVNRVHPRLPRRQLQTAPAAADGYDLLRWLGERDARGLEALRSLLQPPQQLVDIPLLHSAPNDIASLEALGDLLVNRLGLDTA